MIDMSTAPTVTICRWRDDAQAPGGVGPRSPYVDQFWLPLLGPDATCLARLLTRLTVNAADPLRVTVAELRTSLGTQEDPDGLDRLQAGLQGLVEAGIVTVASSDTISIRAEMPYLSDEQVSRLPKRLQAVHQATHALRAEAGQSEHNHPLPATARLLSLSATIDEILTDPSLLPGQLTYRFQHVVRLAQESRDDALIDWADPDLGPTLLRGQEATRAMDQAVWAAQYAVATVGQLPELCRGALSEAAAGMVDWVVDEFPRVSDQELLDDDPRWNGWTGWRN